MKQKLFLNDQEFHLGETQLPCLIDYREKEGGSNFTVALVADIFLRGSKILFFTAYHMAKDNFMERVHGHEPKILLVETADQLVGAEQYQTIIIKSGDTGLCLEALQILKDIADRVILVKNYNILDDSVTRASLEHPKLILSGNVDASMLKVEVSKKSFKTVISFSKSETALPINVPTDLGKYGGYLKSGATEGRVELK